MGKAEFAEYICRPFCGFYKPGAKEDEACGAAEEIWALVQDGRLDPAVWREWSRPERRWTHDAEVEALLCSTCPFLAEGCDFAAGEAAALPCGGFILFSMLREIGLPEPEADDQPA